MQPESSPNEEFQSMAFHPYNVILTLLLMGVTALFLSFSVAFVYSRVQNGLPPVKLPSLFYINTLILVASSGTMWWAKQSYKKDDTEQYQMALIGTLVLSIIFMVAQYFAWMQLFSQDIFIDSSNTASYLYVISGLHFAHVIAGLPFLGMFLFVAYKRMKEPVSVLVYFSDPEKLLKLRLLTRYWHFLDVLWIYLVLFFWVNYMLYHAAY